jgi:hypothetical protein
MMGYILLFGALICIVFGVNYITDYNLIGILLILNGIILFALGIIEENRR